MMMSHGGPQSTLRAVRVQGAARRRPPAAASAAPAVMSAAAIPSVADACARPASTSHRVEASGAA